MSSDARYLDYPSHKKKVAETKKIETVVIDDASEIEPENNLEIVEVLSDDDDERLEAIELPNTKLFQRIMKKGGLLAEVIEKCLELENSDGMERVIKKSLLTYYKGASKTYLKSRRFPNDLFLTLKLLDQDPDHKFSHIKNLCDRIRLSDSKGRVNLIALDIKAYNKLPNKAKIQTTKRKGDEPNINGKTRKVDVIEIDDSEPMVTEIINLDDDQSVALDEREKENNNVNNASPYKATKDDALLQPQKVVTYTQSTEPAEAPEVHEAMTADRIKLLENEIQRLHAEIKVLEEAEVVDDTEAQSPYILCESLKKSLVGHYKNLCQLTGSQARKHKQIRLQVTEGHPQGPTKMLEQFINNRSEGNKFNFPDLSDVIKCVGDGLAQDGLQWGKQQILKEASALFIQCGRALQKCRQKREWKHLLYHVKKERWEEDDPAASDPELMAKLELNRMMAREKERNLLDKYATMQDMPASAMAVANNEMIQHEDDTDACDQEINENVNSDNQMPQFFNNQTSPTYNTNNKNDNGVIENCVGNQFVVETKVAPDGFIEISLPMLNKEQSSIQNDVNRNKVEVKNCNGYLEITADSTTDNDNYDKDIQSNDYILTENNINTEIPTLQDIKETENIKEEEETKCIIENNIVLNDIPVSSSTETTNEQIKTEDSVIVKQEMINECDSSSQIDKVTENKDSDTSEENILESDLCKVKTEPTDEIAKQLKSLGDNYTVSIVDIEDPFLIIEISDSDSDDESETNETES